MNLITKIFGKKEEPKQCAIDSVMSFGYEYFVEVDGEMKKIEDSTSLFEKNINEELFQRRFTDDCKKGVIKGYVTH